MKTKLVILLALAMSALVVNATAGEIGAIPAVAVAVPVETLTVSGQVIFRSQYLGTDVGTPFYNKPVQQGNITFAHSSGLFLDIWTSVGFDNEWNENFAYEIDYTLGYSRKVGNLDVTLSAAYYDCFGLGEGPVNDVVMFSIDVAWPTIQVNDRLSLTPSIGYGYYWIPSSETDSEGGNVANIGLDCSYQLSSKWSVAFSPGILWHDGPFALNPGTILKLGFGLDYKINDTFTLNLIEVTGYVPLIGGDKADVAYGIGFSYSF
jgi:hypothetical protein